MSNRASQATVAERMTDLSELKEGIKLSNPIEEIIRETVPLGHQNKALCPFHKEETPSFFVNIKEQYFHCFGCGAGGDVFNFVMRQKGMSFSEALKYLAERKGIQVSLDNIDFQGEEKRRNINSTLAEAAKIYHKSLSAEVIDYLKGRGLTEETINRYRIGFCNGQSKYNSAQEILLNAGLIYEGGRNYFEGFITFPHMLYGRVVYISGRGYPEKKHKKPEAEKVPLTHLYNEQALSQKEVILAEGEIDTLTLLQYGFNACGVLGAGSFKEEWVDKFKNCETVYLSFDADDAGEKGNLRIAEFLGSKARLVSLPEGEDVNDFFKHVTKEDYQKLLDESLSLIEFKIKAISAQTPRHRLSDILNPILKEIASLDVAKGNAILHHFIKEHFGFSYKDVESYEKVLSNFRKELKKPTAPIILGKSELIEMLHGEEATRVIHPAQDYLDGVMYFTVKIRGEPYIITSDKRLFSFDAEFENGVSLKHKNVDTTRFSPRGIEAFLEHGAQTDIAGLFKKISAYVGRFVIFPEKAHQSFVSLWAMGTYFFMVFRHYPYIWLNAEKGSGKTRLMEVLAPISFNGELIANPTESVIFRDVSNNLISMFIDEVEQMRKNDKDVYGSLIRLLNMGFSKSGVVKRIESTAQGSFLVKSFSAYSPKIIAGINEIDNVLQDRTVRIELWRKKETEIVERYKETPEIQDLQQDIRDSLYIFALNNAKDIAEVYQKADEGIIRGLEHLNNRELDIWEPIFLLANAIDSLDRGEDLVSQMTHLSKISMKDRQSDNASQNNTCKALAVIKIMLGEFLPLCVENGVYVFDAAKTLDYFKKTEEFEWIEKATSLTRQLTRIKIRAEQRRLEGERKRVYLINKAEFEDLCERYGV